jgi:hypothetical protein
MVVALAAPPLLTLALALAAPSATCALEISFAADHAAYKVTHGGTTLFSSTSGVAVFCDDRWWTQRARTLVMQGAPRQVKGTHPVLGDFDGVELSWLAVSPSSNFLPRPPRCGTSLIFVWLGTY